MEQTSPRIRVSLVAIPDVAISSLTGMYEVFNSFGMLATFDDAVPQDPPFAVEIVGASRTLTPTSSGLPVAISRGVEDVDATDIVIVPSVIVKDGVWVPGRHPQIVQWLKAMNRGGALLCSACSGVLLLAETGLLDGKEATLHWAYAPTFAANFPNVKMRLEEVLVATGGRKEFVMSGASASWHDLVLYLIARRIGPTAAGAIARFFMLQWHVDGQAPYVAFSAPSGHGDAVVARLQKWLRENYAVANPVEAMVTVSGLAARSFKRRFTNATGMTPIEYVQHLRVEEAKRRLERTALPVEEISWTVGYENPAFFRRVFKRITRMTPGSYRRKFKMPDIL